MTFPPFFGLPISWVSGYVLLPRTGTSARLARTVALDNCRERAVNLNSLASASDGRRGGRKSLLFTRIRDGEAYGPTDSHHVKCDRHPASGSPHQEGNLPTSTRLVRALGVNLQQSKDPCAVDPF